MSEWESGVGRVSGSGGHWTASLSCHSRGGVVTKMAPGLLLPEYALQFPCLAAMTQESTHSVFAEEYGPLFLAVLASSLAL